MHTIGLQTWSIVHLPSKTHFASHTRSSVSHSSAEDLVMASTSNSTTAPFSSNSGNSFDSITTPLPSTNNERMNGSANNTYISKTNVGKGSIEGENRTSENIDTEEDLWSGILRSVQSSRATPVKNVIILGQPQSGKSTLVSNLANSSPSAFLADSIDVSVDQKANGGTSISQHKIAASDLGLGYGYFDVGDDEGEDTVARVGIYQISSTHPSHRPLLPFAFVSNDRAKEAQVGEIDSDKIKSTNAQRMGRQNRNTAAHINTKPKPSINSLRDSLFLIVLDWEAPWTFLSQLLEWVSVIQEQIDLAVGSSSGDVEQAQWSQERVLLDEMKEQIETFIRSYNEPQGATNATDPVVEELDVGETSTASAIVAVSNPTGMDDEKAPLPEGSLVHNLGVSIVVVCAKADTITQLERQRNFKEEQFDYIQQVLRTICLKYGAALFYTAQSNSQSFDVVREYILHRLFATNRNHSASSSFLFRHRASTVERDVLIVPAGWDSFGKIRALREGFDCESTANGWEWDVQVETIRRQHKMPRGSNEAEEVAERELDKKSIPGLVGTDHGEISSAVKLYEDIIEDWNAIGNASLISGNNVRVKEPDQQTFLSQYYASLQQDADLRLKSGGGTSRVTNSTEEGLDRNTNVRGSVVGPMGSTSLSLPSVERIMQERRMSDENVRSNVPSSAKSAGANRQRNLDNHPPITTRQTVNSERQSPSLSSSDRGIGSRPTSPLGATTTSGSASPLPQHRQSEVLSSFFQSLLNKDKPPISGSRR